jgi:hypothetical protein
MSQIKPKAKPFFSESPDILYLIVESMKKETAIRVLPPILIDAMKYVSRLWPLIRNKKTLNRNKIYRNIYSNEVVYILGNGPSLNNFDLTKLKGLKVITMNNFQLHPNKDDFNIIAHCIGEPYTSTTWQDPSNIIENINAETFWFNLDAVEYFKKNPTKKKINFYLSGVSAEALWIKGDNLTGIALGYQSTSQMAINLALYMGFSNIYLLGLDHDWLVTRGYSPHFYKEQDGVEKSDLSKFTYTQMIEISLKLFKIYKKLKRNSEIKSSNIYNISEPSYLDVFERK